MDVVSRKAILSSGSFDLLVIGGGIVGAGVARDAALGGLRTLLVEQSDFASGTSSRSTRLLHGGLRYLAQGRVCLVREASTEKMRLNSLAPHLCRPLPFVFPAGKSRDWPLWKLSLGVRVYDLLCGKNNLGLSKTCSASELKEIVPGLERATGAVRYFDALTNDARLVIDNLRSAQSAGADVLNYAAFVSAERSRNVWTCAIRDGILARNFEVRTKTVVNASGPWSPKIPHSSVRLRLTKGVHLVIDRSLMSISEAVVMPEQDRILFAVPWGERLILGTTDTDYEGDPGEVRTEPEDVEYILSVLNAHFPKAGVTSKHILSTWAGVRPLTASGKQKPGAPSDLSRGHEIRMPEPGWFDVAGGKLTTHRLIAEQTINRVGRFLRMRLPPSRTRQTKLAPGRFSGVVPPAVEPAVVEESCRNEWALHLEDILLRRTSWASYGAVSDAMVEQVAGWMAKQLNWSHEQKNAELEQYFGTIEAAARR